MGHDAARSRADDPFMVRCQTCGRPFDERAYQIVVAELGSFDSIECAEKALRQRPRRSGDEIATTLLKAASHFQPRALPTEEVAALEESEETQPA
jgi:hypothetical protein